MSDNFSELTGNSPKGWKKQVLSCISLGMGIKGACDQCHISNTLIYRELAKPAFRREWDEAIDRSIVLLEAEAVRRASTTSDYLLWKLLASRLRMRYGEAAGVDVGDCNLTIQINERRAERKAELKSSEPGT